jgi:hypothetical protein
MPLFALSPSALAFSWLFFFSSPRRRPLLLRRAVTLPVGLISGGGRKMYLECQGTGFPTVLLVAGLKGSVEDWNLSAVFRSIGRPCFFRRSLNT